MSLAFPSSLRAAAAIVGLLWAVPVVSAEPVADGEGTARVTVETARDRAQLLHRMSLAALDAMHHYYFNSNRAVLPARAMEDVFADLADDASIEMRWISVNTPAMSVNHEPKGEFEKQAAAAIAAGKPAYEVVEPGRYRRVGAVPLADGCVSCHTGFSMNTSSKPRFAGLVISMPIVAE